MTGEQGLDQQRAQQQAANAELLKGNHWELPSDLKLLEKIREEVESRLLAAGWSEEETYQMGLAFHEAMINAVAHGNLGLESEPGKSLPQRAIQKFEAEGSDKKVIVDLDITENRVVISIEDQGKGFDWKKFDEEEYDPIKMYGKGTKIFIASVFNIERNEKGNKIILTRERLKE